MSFFTSWTGINLWVRRRFKWKRPQSDVKIISFKFVDDQAVSVVVKLLLRLIEPNWSLSFQSVNQIFIVHQNNPLYCFGAIFRPSTSLSLMPKINYQLMAVTILINAFLRLLSHLGWIFKLIVVHDPFFRIINNVKELQKQQSCDLSMYRWYPTSCRYELESISSGQGFGLHNTFNCNCLVLVLCIWMRTEQPWLFITTC